MRPSPPPTSRTKSSSPTETLTHQQQLPTSCPQTRGTILPLSVSVTLTPLGTSCDGIIQGLCFCDWLISLSTLSPRFICVTACVRISFLFQAESTVWMDHILFLQASVSGHAGGLYAVAIVKNAAANTSAQVSLLKHVSLQASGGVQCDAVTKHVGLHPRAHVCTQGLSVTVSLCSQHLYAPLCWHLIDTALECLQSLQSLTLVHVYKPHDFQRLDSKFS